MREKNTRLSVGLRFHPHKTIHVGELVQDGRQAFFQYAVSFLDMELNIAPFHLRRTREVQKADTQVFDGLHGVFADSLPDGWGRLLTDRQLTSKGVSLSTIGPLDRLAIVGGRGPGALVYEPQQYAGFSPMVLRTLDEIAAQSEQLLKEQTAPDLDQLFALGGSSGGARPKVLLGYNVELDSFCPMSEVLPKGYEPWIIKFSSSTDRPDAARIEFAYYKMALGAGLSMAPARLFSGASGRKYFGVKRFDRDCNNRVHMTSAAGLLHDNFRLPAIDYGHLMDASIQLCEHRKAAEDILRLATFNELTHNLDDHSKNFSFLMDKSGAWSFAPAYDLTFSQSSHGEHSITVAGEGRAPGRKHLLQLAETFEIRNANDIIDEVREAVNGWSEIAKICDVSSVSKVDISNEMKKINKQF